MANVLIIVHCAPPPNIRHLKFLKIVQSVSRQMIKLLIKIFFIFPFLILRKAPKGQRKTSMNQLIKTRLGMWKTKEHEPLIKQYERDVK